MERSPPFSHAANGLFTAIAFSVGGYGFVTAWILAALRTGSRAGWMAPLASLIAIVILRATGKAPGPRRGGWAVLMTAGYLTVGEWLVAGLPIAMGMGQAPAEAARHIGADFGWMLIRVGNSPGDWLWIAISLALAALLGR